MGTVRKCSELVRDGCAVSSQVGEDLRQQQQCGETPSYRGTLELHQVLLYAMWNDGRTMAAEFQLYLQARAPAESRLTAAASIQASSVAVCLALHKNDICDILSDFPWFEMEPGVDDPGPIF